jgi:hypothetical protein
MVHRTGNISVESCALCRQSDDLRESHIVPRFVWDWLRRSSGTGFFRFGFAPNKREQDGFKERLLCANCEQLLSRWEKSVAEHLFLPIHEHDASVIDYGPWFGKFCVSITWRILFLFRELGLKHFSHSLLSAAEGALDSWRLFLLDDAKDTGRFQHHCLPLGRLQHSTIAGTAPNMNRYYLRSVEVDVACNVNSAFVYAKLCRLLLVGFIQMPNASKWEGTKIGYSSGTIRPRHYKVPAEFGKFLIERAKNMANVHARMSLRQKAKLHEAMYSNADTIAQSESFRAMMYDVDLFGSSAFWDGE